MNKEPVIARIQPGTKQADLSIDSVDLFFPYSSANRGRVCVWARIGQHGEADLGYYAATRAPRSPREIEVVEEALRQYKFEMSGIPVEDQVELVPRKRFPKDFAERAWA